MGAGGARGLLGTKELLPVSCQFYMGHAFTGGVFALHILALFRFALAGRQNPSSALFTLQPFSEGFLPGLSLSETPWDQLIDMRRRAV